MIDSSMPLNTLLPSIVASTRSLAATCMITLACLLTLAANPVAASELPMGAMVEDPEVSEVLVRKEERRLYLLSGEQVVRSYRIGLGDNPSGHKLFEG
ncbi:MAG: hypothetical protein R3198_12215, partial [Marinobacter sp.]|nr:hypothetical protein [Marinobacter sp.]